MFWAVMIAALAIFVGFFFVFRLSNPGDYFFFDPQDYHDYHETHPAGRVFPRAAASATFEPILKHYLSVTQLLVTVAAASIAFGANACPQAHGLIAAAKLSLAWSILYGVAFCALLLWRYDEYTQDMRSYNGWWYSTIFASGFSSLTCFVLGYLIWGWGLSRIV